MNWQKMIQMRALKEELLTAESHLSIRSDCYQHFVEKALANLEGHERKVIFLRFWEGLTIARIADQMELSWNDTDELLDIAICKIRCALKHFHQEFENRQSISA